MFIREKNLIVMPEIIPTVFIADKKFDMTDVKEGVIPIEQLGLTPNKFYGGNVLKLAINREYGFYICLQRERNIPIGIYIHESLPITDVGKKLIDKHFNADIKFGHNVVEVVVPKITESQKRKAKELEIPEHVLQSSNANELDGLIEAVMSGKSNLSVFEEEQQKITLK